VNCEERESAKKRGRGEGIVRRGKGGEERERTEKGLRERTARKNCEITKALPIPSVTAPLLLLPLPLSLSSHNSLTLSILLVLPFTLSLISL